jgi:hypothetical protein
MIDCSGMATGKDLTLDAGAGNSVVFRTHTKLTGCAASGHSRHGDQIAGLYRKRDKALIINRFSRWEISGWTGNMAFQFFYL